MADCSLKTRLSDLICDFIEAEYVKDSITHQERLSLYRDCAAAFGLNDLLPKRNLKSKIRYRLSNGVYWEEARLPDKTNFKRGRDLTQIYLKLKHGIPTTKR